MRHNDQQLGIPETLYKASKSTIEALSNPVQGMEAYATDTCQLGTYNGATWDWIGSAAIEILMLDGVTTPPVPVTNEAEDDWLYSD